MIFLNKSYSVITDDFQLIRKSQIYFSCLQEGIDPELDQVESGYDPTVMIVVTNTQAFGSVERITQPAVYRGKFREALQLAEQGVSRCPVPFFISSLTTIRLKNQWWYKWPRLVFMAHQRLYFRRSWLFWLGVFTLTVLAKYYFILYVVLLVSYAVMSDRWVNRCLRKAVEAQSI